jgi:protein-tyrosine-phosphatase
MNILFICKHNIFRSRVAEEYMKKISNHNISSAGIIRADGDLISAVQKEVCKEFGLIFTNQSKTLTVENLRKQDLVIIVADDVPQEIFKNQFYNLDGKVRKWEIEDIFYPDKENIRRTIIEIMKRVDELNEELKHNPNI